MDPRVCQNIERETSQRRQCGQCRSLDEATFRLYSWIGSRGASRLETEGGPAEDASSPSEGDNSEPHQEQDDAEIEQTDEEKEPVNLDYLDVYRLRNRPLSGSTVGTSSTIPTVISNTHQPTLANTDGPAEDGDAPLNKGALKRTISTLTFDDLTSGTRTAFPASEAANVPPAYARPRSEVGLPPLPAGENEEAEREDTGEEEEEAEDKMERSRSRSGSGVNSRARPLSAQEYLSEARSKFLESRSSF
jgi:hypothetical protein